MKHHPVNTFERAQTAVAYWLAQQVLLVVEAGHCAGCGTRCSICITRSKLGRAAA